MWWAFEAWDTCRTPHVPRMYITITPTAYIDLYIHGIRAAPRMHGRRELKTAPFESFWCAHLGEPVSACVPSQHPMSCTVSHAHCVSCPLWLMPTVAHAHCVSCPLCVLPCRLQVHEPGQGTHCSSRHMEQHQSLPSSIWFQETAWSPWVCSRVHESFPGYVHGFMSHEPICQGCGVM